jgi:arylformamidase
MSNHLNVARESALSGSTSVQGRDFVAAIKAAGKPVQLLEALNYRHAPVYESVGHPYGPNGRAALAMMKLAPM